MLSEQNRVQRTVEEKNLSTAVEMRDERAVQNQRVKEQTREQSSDNGSADNDVRQRASEWEYAWTGSDKSEIRMLSELRELATRRSTNRERTGVRHI
ncbi:hypothetical protein R1flu_022480 [Riccia fluitans]|uniref:Uncharacterized protein n=1 Tax=Riccia fluitans TaxID=41844 RepID=A0ABD1XPZ4_9MARC